MSWSEQAETLMNALTEAQMTMWKSWCDLIQTATEVYVRYYGLPAEKSA